MKTRILFLALLLWAARLPAQDYTFLGKTFHLAYTNSSSEGYLNEYVLKGQTLKNWTNLFAVRGFKQLDSPERYIATLSEGYHKRYPDMRYSTGTLTNQNRWVIDFLIYPADKTVKFMEWNFFRAQTNAAGGIIVFQYAERRYYKKSVKELDAWDVKALRKEIRPTLMTNEFAVP